MPIGNLVIKLKTKAMYKKCPCGEKGILIKFKTENLGTKNIKGKTFFCKKCLGSLGI